MQEQIATETRIGKFFDIQIHFTLKKRNKEFDAEGNLEKEEDTDLTQEFLTQKFPDFISSKDSKHGYFNLTAENPERKDISEYLFFRFDFDIENNIIPKGVITILNNKTLQLPLPVPDIVSLKDTIFSKFSSSDIHIQVDKQVKLKYIALEKEIPSGDLEIRINSPQPNSNEILQIEKTILKQADKKKDFIFTAKEKQHKANISVKTERTNFIIELEINDYHKLQFFTYELTANNGGGFLNF